MRHHLCAGRGGLVCVCAACQKPFNFTFSYVVTATKSDGRDFTLANRRTDEIRTNRRMNTHSRFFDSQERPLWDGFLFIGIDLVFKSHRLGKRGDVFPGACPSLGTNLAVLLLLQELTELCPEDSVLTKRC